ncbi:response regulator [Nitratidesulfovibrio liaohensis]|uniref:histidine kinase n=1 Tax=Nitratidesulfovibrio liaohensis TaxID=2604158 RepID=A0ABY9QWX6_9BACT|nr:response regulator [Nitratidesulfovibrio liaohensis]WMW64040.1 response regulator [Nitratidesulfovibrio liaohensis]
MMRALLVDDETAFAELLAERLRARGIAVRTAYDAESALALLDAGEEFDVAVLDVCLPGASGIDLLRRMKARLPLVEALMLTGSSDVRNAVEGMRHGAFNYLLKPANIDDLVRELRSAHERKLRQEENARMIEAGKLASIGRLAEGVAHEINNPVNIMTNAAGWIEDLLDEPDLASSPHAAEMRRSVVKIKAQSRRVREITRKLLFFGKGLDPRPGPVRVADLLGEALRLLADRAADLGVAVRLDVPPDTPLLVAPPVELRQVFVHVAENALDAVEYAQPPVTERELAVSVRVEFPPAQSAGFAQSAGPAQSAADATAPSPSTASPPSGGEICIAFHDTGHGIASEVLPHVFEPFFSTRPVGRGMGLGLSVAVGVITALGGFIDIDSQPGNTTVTLRLPLPEAPTEAAPPTCRG